MSEIQAPTPQEQPPTPGASESKPNGRPAQQKRGPHPNQIYALPAPIRTFPLPTFYPNNPVSLLHVAYAWVSQAFRPPPAEPAVIHHGTWSATTSSVNISDEKTMRALWEQGFYGKGTLSRSEPNWLKREQVRRGLQEVHVSEILTVQRRKERAEAKWERARLEQEAIRQTRLEEARRGEARRAARDAGKAVAPFLSAPVGPLELLALPNSASEFALGLSQLGSLNQESTALNGASSPPELTRGASLLSSPSPQPPANLGGLPTGDELHVATETPNGSLSPVLPSDSAEVKTLKRQKSVRFSPRVDSTTYQLMDPPSPNHSPSEASRQELVNGAAKPNSSQASAAPELEAPAIVNKEHLQLMPEETLFLTFGLGALAVTDPSSGEKLSNQDLLTLFRQHSYFPPRNGPDDPDLQPDDGFLVHYAVYHHFRSLGWVPRAGIKFGVDWLLYTRGPVFDHAEFGLMVIPSYSDPWWKASGKQPSERTWQWMHSVVRVLSHVMKSLVLVYVDVPPPSKLDNALEEGIAEALKLYTVREVMVKRWSSNRNR